MEWFEEWFGADYVDLYAHRNELEAARQVNFVCKTLHLLPEPRTAIPAVLDVACGWGRHLIEFKRRGIPVLGIDLSAVLLHKALGADPALKLLRADMRRLPCRAGAFSLVLSFFTSFGYFKTDSAHEALLREWLRVLQPGGSLLIDYMHKPFILETLEPETSAEHPEGRVVQRRALRNGRVEKVIELQNREGAVLKTFTESVRLYSPEELTELLIHAGFSKIQLFDTDNFGPLTGSSRALLALAEKVRAA